MPKDCQTSDWSSWSYCSKTCRSTDLSPGYRVRTRIMTQIPHGGGKQCPGLQEKEACNIIGDLLPKCHRYPYKRSMFISFSHSVSLENRALCIYTILVVIPVITSATLHVGIFEHFTDRKIYKCTLLFTLTFTFQILFSFITYEQSKKINVLLVN